MVSSANLNEIANNQSTKVPMYRTWWFQLIAISFFLAIVFVFAILARRYQIRKRQLSVLDTTIMFMNQPQQGNSNNIDSDFEDTTLASAQRFRHGGIQIKY